MRATLTPKQLDAYRIIKKMVAQTGHGPSVRELMGPLGLHSTSGVHRLLTSLQQRGWIIMDVGKKRAIRIIADENVPLVDLDSPFVRSFLLTRGWTPPLQEWSDG